MSQPIITRFAPSPTGYLHIGGARTALFNWAFAQSQGGKFLLRIEDTDKARSTTEAIDAILKGMDWLGLEADGEPVYQSKQQDRHIVVANQLLESGHAYLSYASDEEIEDIRAKAREAGVAARYPGRDEPIADEFKDQSVVRFKAPIEGETTINDLVQGDVTIRNDQLDDLVLLRSDGTPTYMLAVVVDDHDMGITHVIRGDDHLTNCAKQIQIYEALKWDLPHFAHIPLIHGSDGAKLSKRHGALGAEAYKAMGYLPEAMRNYLARLGWSHGDDEIIPTDKLIEWFDLDGINKAPARFDMAKLDHINGHYITESSDDEVLEALKSLINDNEFTPELSYSADLIDLERLKLCLPFLRERAKTLIELIETAAYLFKSCPLDMDAKAQKALEKEGVSEILKGVHTQFTSLEDWNRDNIETLLKDYAQNHDLKFGKIAPPLRSALTGSMVSPGIYDVIHSLGRDEVLKRINDVIPA